MSLSKHNQIVLTPEIFKGIKEECECNYKGSSNGMGIAGVKAIWLRSVKNLKIRYITFSGDGDAKTFACLTELKHEDQLRLYKSQKRASELQKKRRKY